MFVFVELSSQTFSDRVREVRTFKAGSTASVEIDNKYGKVHVIPWDTDSVKIEAELYVSSNNLSRMEKTKNSIRFDFTATHYYITAKTNFGTTGSQFFNDLKGLSGNIIPGSGTVEINYTVYCPINLNLSIINKFGDIYIDNLKGDLKISLSNGDLKINSLKGNAQIELSFGTGIINEVSEGKLNVSYSDLLIRKAGSLMIESKSSTLNINESKLVRLDSKRDKYFFTKAHKVAANGFFSQFWIEDLDCEIDAKLKFGNMNMTRVGLEFCQINISSEYADIQLSFEKGASYEADIFYHPEASIQVPKNAAMEETVISAENSSLQHKHFRSGDSVSQSSLRISALQKCVINLEVNP